MANSNTKVVRIEGKLMKVNSYLVESTAGVLIVDGMLTVSDARAVRRHIDALGRPVLGAIVTHAHPDHYAGLHDMLLGLDATVYATPDVRRVIERDDPIKDAIVGPMMGAEWPKQRIFPGRDVASGSTLSLGDGQLELRVRDIGPAESPADSLWMLDERSWFTGDLVYNGMHAYLADGHQLEWLRVLDRLEAEIDPEATLYVGHGEPGTARSLFGAQRRYIETFVESVGRHRRLEPEARRVAVMQDMKRALPSDELAFLTELSVDPVARALD